MNLSPQRWVKVPSLWIKYGMEINVSHLCRRDPGFKHSSLLYTVGSDPGTWPQSAHCPLILWKSAHRLSNNIVTDLITWQFQLRFMFGTSFACITPCPFVAIRGDVRLDDLGMSESSLSTWLENRFAGLGSSIDSNTQVPSKFDQVSRYIVGAARGRLHSP